MVVAVGVTRTAKICLIHSSVPKVPCNGKVSLKNKISMLVLCSKEKSHFCFKNLSFSYESKIIKKKRAFSAFERMGKPHFLTAFTNFAPFLFCKKSKEFFMSFAFLTFYV